MTGSDPSAAPRDCGNDAPPYVLGALEPAEARAFAHHMQSCAVCRDEVAALAPVLDVLAASTPRYDVSAALRRRVVHAARSEPKASSTPARRSRRSPRPWTLRAALAIPRPAVAAALAVAVTLGVVIATGSGGSPVRMIQASVGHAQLHVAGGHGELIVDRLPPAPPDRVYELWLQHGSQTPAPSTLFAVTSRGTAVLGVPGGTSGITRVLVTVEPSGGSRVPTTRAVIVARV
jgi:anti-sigma-K factor RskA